MPYMVSGFGLVDPSSTRARRLDTTARPTVARAISYPAPTPVPTYQAITIPTGWTREAPVVTTTYRLPAAPVAILPTRPAVERPSVRYELPTVALKRIQPSPHCGPKDVQLPIANVELLLNYDRFLHDACILFGMLDDALELAESVLKKYPLLSKGAVDTAAKIVSANVDRALVLDPLANLTRVYVLVNCVLGSRRAGERNHNFSEYDWKGGGEPLERYWPGYRQFWATFVRQKARRVLDTIRSVADKFYPGIGRQIAETAAKIPPGKGLSLPFLGGETSLEEVCELVRSKGGGATAIKIARGQIEPQLPNLRNMLESAKSALEASSKVGTTAKPSEVPEIAKKFAESFTPALKKHLLIDLKRAVERMPGALPTTPPWTGWKLPCVRFEEEVIGKLRPEMFRSLGDSLRANVPLLNVADQLITELGSGPIRNYALPMLKEQIRKEILKAAGTPRIRMFETIVEAVSELRWLALMYTSQANALFRKNDRDASAICNKVARYYEDLVSKILRIVKWAVPESDWGAHTKFAFQRLSQEVDPYWVGISIAGGKLPSFQTAGIRTVMWIESGLNGLGTGVARFVSNVGLIFPKTF